MEIQELFDKLKGSVLGEQMEALHNLYAELDEKQQLFCDSFDLHCKEDCCNCCAHFFPDVTDLEAQYIAMGLISEGRDQEIPQLLSSKTDDKPPCPLCDMETHIFHCRIYRWRPLLCRLVGAAVSKDKNGEPTFRNCKWNEHTHELDTAELEKNIENVVVMSDYGMRMEELNINNTQTKLITEALGPAIEKINLILSYEEG